VEADDPAFTNDTQNALRLALQVDPNDVFAWGLSAKSYAIDNQPGMSAYAAAERALLMRQFGEVVRYTRKAEEILPTGTPVWLRLQDLKAVARNYMEDQRQRRR
jgi:predicted Zn-dependent protease